MKTYHITELGRRFGLSRSALLYYDKVGLLRPSGRTQADYRVYTQDDLSRLERICFFRETGLSLAEIALLIANSKDSQILERRLREIGREVAALRSQQRLISAMLKTIAGGQESSGLDKTLWLSLQKASGLNESARKHWHAEFERKAPEAHHDFLLSLGLTEKEALQVRMLTKSVEDNKMEMKYFYEVVEDLPRQGPGCEESTLKALSWVKGLPQKPRVLDIGCGNGMQTQILAQKLKTKIIAIDNHLPVLENLNRIARSKALPIETRELSMIDMPFDPDFFDLIWAEGSLFIIGVARGLKEFRAILKPNGFLAFSEMCWFTESPPPEPKEYFHHIYPDLKSIPNIQDLAEASGYKVIQAFKLPEDAWWNDYYNPMLSQIKNLKIKNAGIPEAETVYDHFTRETQMFKKYSKSYGYAFFVLQRIDHAKP